MDHHYPVYTEERECKGCRTCLRHCPVKAIGFRGGRAAVIPERCVACGHCVNLCPTTATRVRDDLGRARNLLQHKERVFVSLAPSYVSEFAGVDAGNLISAIRALGFAGVSETALGAQEVSAQVADRLGRGTSSLTLSSACPAAVGYVRKYLPTLANDIVPLLSPVLAHCRMLRQAWGEAIGIVFIGPCVATKRDADRHPELLDLALTFRDLRRWLEESELDPARLVPGPQDRFIPEAAPGGALYALEGEMNDAIRLQGTAEGVRFLTAAGIPEIIHILSGLRSEELTAPVVLELLACPGGCVNGPCRSSRKPWLLERLEVLERATPSPVTAMGTVPLEIGEYGPEAPLAMPQYEEGYQRAALRRIGIELADDELNCGGCGYETCRDLARALHEGRAEPSMCPIWLRTQTEKKIDALLRCMPAGVVIVDADLTVMDCNETLARMFDEDTLYVYQAWPDLAGARLERLVPFAGSFQMVLDTGQDIHRETLRLEGRIFSVAIFSIEPHRLIGGFVLDVTSSEMPRVQIAQLAQEVIRKNLEMVQEVACRLGENMADTEILLRSLADGHIGDGRTHGGEAEPGSPASGKP